MSMDRRHFLLTSLAGAAPTHLLTPAGAEQHVPAASPAPGSPAAYLIALSNEMRNLAAAVESYGQLMLQAMDDAHSRRHVALALTHIGRGLSENTVRMRALAARLPSARPAAG